MIYYYFQTGTAEIGLGESLCFSKKWDTLTFWPYGAGACVTPVSSEFSYQIFLSGSHKGHHTVLSSPITNYFRECSACARARGEADEHEEDFEIISALIDDATPGNPKAAAYRGGTLFDLLRL